MEMVSYSDPEAHAVAYTLHASSSLLLNSVITYVNFVDEPDKNRVKVTWRALPRQQFRLVY